MTIIIAAVSLLVGFLAAIPVKTLAHRTEVNRIKSDALKAQKHAVDDAYMRGYQRCYSHEVTNLRRTGGDMTALMDAIH